MASRTDPTRTIGKAEAQLIASSMCPRIFQRWKNNYDLIRAIPGTSTGHDHVLYYAVRANDVAIYVVYGVYHEYDPVARHQHDFEGIALEVVDNGQKQPYVEAALSIAHLNYEFTKKPRQMFLIEAGGHGVHPLKKECWEPDVWCYFPSIFEFQDMQEWDEKEADRIDKLFGEPVKTPWRWVCRDQETYAQKKHPVINGKPYFTTRGLLWTEPEIVFEFARRMGKL